MMDKSKINNYVRAVASLEKSLASPITEERDLAGIIKSFEYSYELAWTTLKSVLTLQGQESQGPRDVLKRAWQCGILTAGSEKTWLNMIADRNLTVHTYDEVFAQEMVMRIRHEYVAVFVKLREQFENMID